MAVELIAGAFILGFAAIAVLGHVLVVTAIYKCLREDYLAGRGRRTTGGSAADTGTQRAAGAVNLGEAREPQARRAFGRLGWTEKASSNCQLPAGNQLVAGNNH
jgi:hypothetical protein